MTTATFIAFEPSESALAAAIGDALTRQGLSVRLAGEETRRAEAPGVLAEAVSAARAVVAVLSPAAAASAWMRKTLTLAMNNGRPIYPALAADVPVDSWLRLAVDQTRLVDLRNGTGTGALEALAAGLQAKAAEARVIAMLNIKGGVGKTVLAANLFAAAHLADGRGIVFIDLDPQNNLTQYFLPAAERHRLRQANQTIHSILVGRGPGALDPEAFARAPAPLNRSKGAGKPRFDIVAGDERLFEFTLDARSERDKIEAFARFNMLIEALRPKADAIIIDANPCATFLTRLAVSAADHIVAPVRPEKYSLTGLNMLEHVVADIRGRPLRPAEFSVLLNGVSDRTRTRAHPGEDAATRAEIAAAPFFGSALLADSIPYTAALKAAPTDRYAANPINVTAMMRMANRDVKASLAGAAAAILRRARG